MQVGEKMPAVSFELSQSSSPSAKASSRYDSIRSVYCLVFIRRPSEQSTHPVRC